MNFIKRWGMWGVVVCLLGAAALVLFVPWLIKLRFALLIAAGVLFLVTVAFNWREGASILGRRGTRYGASAALLIVIALGVAVLANAVSLRYNARWDLTENKRHCRSSQAVKDLQALTAPVAADLSVRSDTRSKRTA